MRKEKHSRNIDRNYIKTEKIEKEYSKIISKAFKIRTDSDYKDFYLVTREETKEQLENAGKFLERIKKYIEEIYLGSS